MTLLDELAARVGAMRAEPPRRRVVVGVTGLPGAGKSTLAAALVRRLGGFPGVAHVPMDGFHLADVELARLGRLDRKGAPDTFDPGGYAALLRRVAAGEPVWAPGFDRGVIEQPIAQSVPVLAETRVVVTEGLYLLLDRPEWRAVRAHCDEVWSCREAEVTRLARLVERHVRFGKTPDEARAWVARSDQANARLVAEHSDPADLVLDLDGLDLR